MNHLVIVHRNSVTLDAAACFSITDDTCELLRIVVHPLQQRCGLGRRLIASGIDWAQACAARRMMLEVDQSNEPALGLYRELGFTVIAKRNDYYGSGHHALVMERQVHQSE